MRSIIRKNCSCPACAKIIPQTTLIKIYIAGIFVVGTVSSGFGRPIILAIELLADATMPAIIPAISHETASIFRELFI